MSVGVVVGLFGAPRVTAQWSGIADRDHPAINYLTTPTSDAVAGLQRRLDRRERSLARDPRTGYLPAVLEALDVPVSSQVLVFSRTSLQKARISPRTPRAIYFSDRVYVAFVPGGSVLEVAAVDPRQGVMFYTLDQRAAVPRFQRQTTACLECHDTRASTGGVPGLLFKSHYTTSAGEVLAPAGAFGAVGRGPLANRWGGWFVTGTHGRQTHLGNGFAARGRKGPDQDVSAGANHTTLPVGIEQHYPSRHSDIAALLVLEHQVRTQNLVTRLGYRTRMALDFEAARTRAGATRATGPEPGIRAYIEREAEPLVRALLYIDEPLLEDPVAGTSDFAREYSAKGPRDRTGRSLFELDLTTRVPRYRCSPLVYSPAFAALPPLAREVVLRRVSNMLSSADRTQEAVGVTAADRLAARAILRETLPGFAAAAGRHAPPE